MTDEVIFAISALSSQPIKKLSFSGCIEVTDIGLKTLTAFTTLETVRQFLNNQWSEVIMSQQYKIRNLTIAVSSIFKL